MDETDRASLPAQRRLCPLGVVTVSRARPDRAAPAGQPRGIGVPAGSLTSAVDGAAGGGAAGGGHAGADEVTRALIEQRTATDARIVALLRERDGIVASADLSNTDDEHDPEGATLAFEREQIAALLRSARSRLGALDAALARVQDGSYGVCVGCGGAIPAGRLLARPDTSTCVGCAGR